MAKKRTRKGQVKRPGSKPAHTNPSGPPVEAFAALDAWATEVAACLSQDELGVLAAIYRRIASDRRVSTDNRRLARKQVQSLQKYGEQ